MAARQSSGLSHDLDEPSTPHDHPNVFSDDYAESFADDYADSQDGMSIRRASSVRSVTPPVAARQSLTRDPPTQQPTVYPISSHQPSSSISKTGLSRPLSTDHAHLDDPFADSHDQPVLPPISTRFSSMAHRSVSSASFAGSQSPGSVHEGPSHPYAMYPQNLSMSRTPSVATASTRTASQLNHNLSRGPAHPYDSYSQNVSNDTGAGQGSIPLGFPGANNSSYRRVGPEGEEQDIIGADGHAEQLPPYSRYPEDAHLKTTTLSALPVIGELSPTHSIAPGTSQEALTQHSTRSTAALNPSNQASSESGTGLSEKNWRDSTWRERRRMKMCGLPLWFWAILVGAILLTIIVTVAVIGGVFAGARAHAKEKQLAEYSATHWRGAQSAAAMTTASATLTQTALIGAKPLTSTPSNIVSMPTGRFEINPGNPTAQTAGCLPPQEQNAWSCNFPTDKMTVSVANLSNGPLLSIDPIDHDIWYGVQPPALQRVPVKLVYDTQTPGDPVAFQFQTIYKKQVILKEDQLDFNATLQARDLGIAGGMDGPGFGIQDKSLLQSDLPWFCEWPGTFIEVMVYVGNGSTVSAVGNSTPSPSSSSQGFQGSFTPPASYLPSSTTAPPTPTFALRDYSQGPPPSPGPTYPAFSQMVKIEERRLDQNGTTSAMPPTCTQMMNIGQNGSMNYVPYLFNGNQLRVFKLNETDPVNVQMRRDELFARQQPVNPSECACTWYSPNGNAPSPQGQPQQQQ